jgi:hypothetical protein
MSTYFDIIIIIIASRSNIYDRLISNYWLPFLNFIKKNNYNIKLLFIFGNNIQILDLNIPNENIYISNSQDNLVPGILVKTMNVFEYIQTNYTYKHILRTNLSSFFILHNLIKLNINLPNNNLYAAVIGNYNNILFGSGAGFWMSSDIVDFILKNKTNIQYYLPDDVAIGKILEHIKIYNIPRYDLTNDISYNDDGKEQQLNNIINNNHYHVRIKNELNRNIDIDLITYFTKKLY